MTATVVRWTTGPLGQEIDASLARLAAADAVVCVAVMPDAHLAHDVCVGTVLATRDRIYPSAVGGDIGCGVAAVGLDAAAAALADERVAARVISRLYATVPCIKHRDAPEVPEALFEGRLGHPSLERRRDRDGRFQFGTLGRGNHFLEMQCDDSGGLWIMAHTGSRGMGSAIRDHHLRDARVDAASGLKLLDSDSTAGRAYLADHAWALRYAAANRRRVLDLAVEVAHEVVGASPVAGSFVECHHNHVRSETHFGEDLLVHRKGAISAADGEPGIIPGSMGAGSYLTLGRGCAEALRSSSHGAGRAMSRTEARRRIPLSALRRDLRDVWYDHRRERQLLDEAPGAYRDIEAVMRAQRDLTRIARRLRPVLSFKG